ncbi:MAG: helix-turn-helix transcriptional regulator [Ilumatobacteraceae bacterium]
MARPQRGAEERLRRLLVMLPWLMERGEVELAEVAERFRLSEDDVAADLELAAMCGLPPFVDELIDVFIDEGTVFVGVPRLFTRPLRLNSTEAFELLAAGRAAMELPGADPSGPLGRGLAKLAAALGDTSPTGASSDEGIDVDLERPEAADQVADAARRLERLRIAYWSASRDESTERVITPRQVYADRGNWYVTATDHRTESLRTFRIDRIESLVPTGEIGEATDEALPEPGRWFVDGGMPRVTLRLAPAARWVIERYPVDDVSEPDADGWVTARLPVASDRWLERVLVRLGDQAQVVDPAHFAELGRAAAARIVARYRAT